MSKRLVSHVAVVGLALAAVLPVAGLGAPGPRPGPIPTKPPRCLPAGSCLILRFRVSQLNSSSRTVGRGTAVFRGQAPPLRIPGQVLRGTASGTIVHTAEGFASTRRLELRVGGAVLAYRRLGGVLGTTLSLSVAVSASTESSCPVGSKGKVVITDGRRDALVINLRGCGPRKVFRAGSGSRVKVIITRPKLLS